MIPQIAAGAVFLCCAVVIAADDYTFRIVPDRILVILFTTGALYGLVVKDTLGEDLDDTLGSCLSKRCSGAFGVSRCHDL